MASPEERQCAPQHRDEHVHGRLGGEHVSPPGDADGGRHFDRRVSIPGLSAPCCSWGSSPEGGTGSAAARPASARPIGGRQTKMSPWAKRPASTLRDRSNLKDLDGTDEKALVGQLTRALNSLEGRVGNMSADELREQVAAAARAAQTAAKVAASPSGKSSKQMLAKVRADLRALEEIVKS